MTITVSGLGFSYGSHRVLGGVNGELGPGVVGLLGVNGAGKTTLLRMLATVTRPDEGSVVVDGADPARRRDRRAARAALGYLPQDGSWNPQFTVEELCHYFAWLRRVPRPVRSQQVAETLAWVDLATHARTKLGRLSGGQHRRAMIAQALVHRPTTLILDEPTSGLDPEQRVAFRALVQSLSKDRTVVLSTHLVEDVAHTAEQVVVVHDGQFAFAGSREEMRALAYQDQPGISPYEQAFHRIVSGEAA